MGPAYKKGVPLLGVPGEIQVIGQSLHLTKARFQADDQQNKGTKGKSLELHFPKKTHTDLNESPNKTPRTVKHVEGGTQKHKNFLN